MRERAAAPPGAGGRLLRELLWIDCGAAFLAGLTVLSLSGWLGRLYAMPRGLLLAMGAANLGCRSPAGPAELRGASAPATTTRPTATV